MSDLSWDPAFRGGSSGFDGVEVVAALRADDRRGEPMRVVSAEETVAVVVHRAGHRFEHCVPDHFDRGSRNEFVAVCEDDRELVVALGCGLGHRGADASEFEAVDDLCGTR